MNPTTGWWGCIIKAVIESPQAEKASEFASFVSLVSVTGLYFGVKYVFFLLHLYLTIESLSHVYWKKSSGTLILTLTFLKVCQERDGFLCILLFLVLLFMPGKLSYWCGRYFFIPFKCLALSLEESHHRILTFRLGTKQLKIKVRGNLQMPKFLNLILTNVLKWSESLTAHWSQISKKLVS